VNQYKFTILLATLLLLMFLSPFLLYTRFGQSPLLSAIVTSTIFSLLWISAANAVSDNRQLLRIVWFWTGLIVILQITYGVTRLESLVISMNVLTAGLLCVLLSLLINRIFQADKVDLEMISISLCGYLLLGIFWADIYSIVAYLDPGAFRGAVADLQFGGDSSGTALYFSYVTLSTLGYGDITPVNPSVGILCTTEAITGQIYLTVLVARLVGLHIATHQRL